MRIMLLALLLTFWVFAEPVTLRVADVPESGLVLARVNLTGLVKTDQESATTLAVRCLRGDIPVQFVPDTDFDAVKNVVGTIVLKLEGGKDAEIQLEAVPITSEVQKVAEPVDSRDVLITFGGEKTPAFPTKMEFRRSGKVFEQFSWYDRLYDNEKREQFWLREDKDAAARIESAGDICTVVRCASRYLMPDSKGADSQPAAVYDWYIFKDSPLVYVSGVVRQDKDFIWDELHFLELNYPDKTFTHFIGAEQPASGEFSGSQKSTVFSNWGALTDGVNTIAALGGKTTIHDGLGSFGNYLNAVWEVFRSRERQVGAWLWIGETAEPDVVLPAALATISGKAKVAVIYPDLEKKLKALCAGSPSDSEEKKRVVLWMQSMARTLAAEGNPASAMVMAEGNMPEDMVALQAGDLALAMQVKSDGVKVRSLFDLQQSLELNAAERALPLFEIDLSNSTSENKMTLNSSEGWEKVTATTEDGLRITFSGQGNTIVVQVWCQPRPSQSGCNWKIDIDSGNSDWSVENVRFPQIAAKRLGENTTALVPIGPGQMRPDAGKAAFSYDGRYPSGWCSMPIMGVFQESNGLGLYYAVHDEWGSTRQLLLESEPGMECIRMVFETPLPDMGKAKKYAFCGEGVWQLVRGGWFDAAMIYKQWAREHARWWPALSAEGREDTALWMRELSVWALSGGAPEECVKDVKEFQEYLGVPCGFHWYNWHQIPFDNDYPHYFPTKNGFTQAVSDLQQHDVFVMPYINGRLWDTRDRGAEDFEYTSAAFPSVTKQPNGEAFTETYGSKESDGSPVRLGVMCPTTQLWQDTVRDIVLRLQNECGVSGVYIDQIAAASPVLCMDTSHGHPLGGGHWWNEGYWKLLQGIRGKMAEERMITTECNAEPFIRWMDGYLTWHWQYDGAVPVFPAIYGGAIQMFGRSYGGGDTRDLALRMRAAQQLVYGEQLGWINPRMLLDSESKDFFRKAVRMRYACRRYFYAGEMAQPPTLTGMMPKVKADWQWGGEMWVTTDAVLVGTWRLPQEKRHVVFFANASDESVTVQVDMKAYCAGKEKAIVRVRDAESERASFTFQEDYVKEITLPAREILAWEIM